jgi:threonylcarbamoyladenosine tRNA methylthiotransferase MtaB
VSFDENAEAYVLNTCTVTAKSEQKARQWISRVRRERPGAVLFVCGCWPQRDPQGVLDIGGVDAVLGTRSRARIAQAVQGVKRGDKANLVLPFTQVLSFEEEGCGARYERTRTHVKIEDGCDRHCTYCIIPAARGPVRSRSLEGITAECDGAAMAGRHEVVLAGIRLTAFGRERGQTLLDAVEAAAKTPIHRIRLGSLDPDDIDDDFIRRAAEVQKLCRHFHLSLQSGSDCVLKRMGRRYTASAYAALTDRIRHFMPDASFTTDVMCGFVGETQREHEENCRFVRDIGFARIHVFPYSRREGTAAARMEGHLDNAVKQARTREMLIIGSELENAYARSRIGWDEEVVWEQEADSMLEGHARSFLRVRFDSRFDSETRDGKLCPREGEMSIVRIRSAADGAALA